MRPCRSTTAGSTASSSRSSRARGPHRWPSASTCPTEPIVTDAPEGAEVRDERVSLEALLDATSSSSSATRFPRPPMGDWRTSAIPGVLRRTIELHPDDRGSFAELWRASWTNSLDGEMRQANLSRSTCRRPARAPRTPPTSTVTRRTSGSWRTVIRSSRSSTCWPVLADAGVATVETIEAAPGDAVYLPAGVAHGFYCAGADHAHLPRHERARRPAL